MIGDVVIATKSYYEYQVGDRFRIRFIGAENGTVVIADNKRVGDVDVDHFPVYFQLSKTNAQMIVRSRQGSSM